MTVLPESDSQQGDAPPHRSSRPGHHRHAMAVWHLIWVAPVTLVLITLVILLLLQSEKGNEAAGPLSVLLTGMSLIFSILIHLVGPRRPPSSDDTKLSHISVAKWTRKTILIVSLPGMLALLVGGILILWIVLNKPDIQMTDHLIITSGEEIRAGREAKFDILEDPSARDKLSLTLRLENLREVGDCVAPARLDITLKGDGVERQRTSGIRSEEEIELNMQSVTRSATLVVYLSTPDPDCLFRIHVDEAVLFN
ncbi:MAG: hypothetical protein ACRDTG_30305 [Pseudonocardiaceae bacterium]